MKRLPRPRANYRRDLRSVLTAVEQQFHATLFDAACRQAHLYTQRSPERLRHMQTVIASASVRSFWVDLYTSRRNAVRLIKDGLHDALDDITGAFCQYCGLSEPSTLDHYLEKSKLSELSLFTRNLIPCCPYCNVHRGPAFASDGDRRILHFYDDDVDAIPDVLVASVTISASHDVPVAMYSVATPTSAATAALVEVYRRHFAALHLDRRYKKAAAAHLRELRQLQQTRPSSRSSLVNMFADKAVSRLRSYGTNDHLAALYRGITASRDALDWLLE